MKLLPLFWANQARCQLDYLSGAGINEIVPSLHQLATALERVTTFISAFHGIFVAMGKGLFRKFAGKGSFFVAPISERRAEPVDGQPVPQVLEAFKQRRVGKLLAAGVFENVAARLTVLRPEFVED